VLSSLARLALAVPALALVQLLPGCLQQLSTGDGTGGSTGGGTTSGSSSATSSSTTPTGAGCSTDPQTGVTLCQQISLCPGVSVDQDQLPGCGFRIHPGAVIDVECLCNDALCPVSVPNTCSQVADALSSASALSVCQDAFSGRCTTVIGSDAGGSSNTASSSCDRQCQSECAGDPDCYLLCGC
jgi:hypothetical protein